MANVTATQFKAQCVSKGCPPDDCDKVAALPGINLANILTLLETYGPGLLTLVLSLFGQAPVPPPLTPVPPAA